MHLTPYCGDIDRERMLELVRENPYGHVHVIDLPYRLCSWAFENPTNIGLWQGEDDRLLAWAVLQPPFWTIDYAIHPHAPPSSLAIILQWVDRQAQSLLHSTFGRPAWFVPVLEGMVDVERTLQAAGFTEQTNVENPWSMVTMVLEQTVALPPCPIKSGYRLRPLQGEAEVAAYVALHRDVFDSENMTEEWRRRTLNYHAHNAALDLVIEDSAGALVAFCIGWLATLPESLANAMPTIVGQIEPIGVREDARRHGIAWSILAEMIQRMRVLGAQEIYVQTDSYRDRTFAFYQSAGFRVCERINIFRKDYAAENPTR
jgi:ribosomal protein S18 acetylase RimI-like enzyme